MYKTTRTNVITLTILVLAFLAGSTAYAAPEPALKKAPSQDSVKFLKSLSEEGCCRMVQSTRELVKWLVQYV